MDATDGVDRSNDANHPPEPIAMYPTPLVPQITTTSNASVPTLLRGMGLPFELWDHIIGLLMPKPYTLLACCLTCKSFRKRAQQRLYALFHPSITVDNHTDIDHVVEEVRT